MPTSSVEHRPYWWQDAPPVDVATPDIDDRCDVAIIGAGYTGLCAALQLAENGWRVQVFDREHPGYGASTRNGGITSGNLALSPSTLLARFGESSTRAMLTESVRAREYLRDLIARHAIDCDYQLNGRFTGALTLADLDSMRNEADTLHRLSGIESTVVTETEVQHHIGSSSYVGGLVRHDIGHFHPAKFLNGLLQAAVNAGAIVHAHTPVTHINGHHVLHTSRGNCRAERILVTTNAYQSRFDTWLDRRIVPAVSRIIVTEKLSRNLVASLMPQFRAMGENRRLFRYFRPTPDGERILFGTREPIVGNTITRATEHVRQGMVAIFPELADARIDYSWSGKVAYSRDKLPMLLERNGIHYALGYCGSGTVWAPWLGHRAATLLQGEADRSTVTAFPDKEPSAIPLYKGKPWFMPFAMSWHYLQDLRSGRSR